MGKKKQSCRPTLWQQDAENVEDNKSDRDSSFRNAQSKRRLKMNTNEVKSMVKVDDRFVVKVNDIDLVDDDSSLATFFLKVRITGRDATLEASPHVVIQANGRYKVEDRSQYLYRPVVEIVIVPHAVQLTADQVPDFIAMLEAAKEFAEALYPEVERKAAALAERRKAVDKAIDEIMPQRKAAIEASKPLKLGKRPQTPAAMVGRRIWTSDRGLGTVIVADEDTIRVRFDIDHGPLAMPYSGIGTDGCFFISHRSGVMWLPAEG